jgi:hypothetical protein
MIKRIIRFNRYDWMHIGFLLKNSVVQFFKGNLNESKDALMWIKIHLQYDSNKIK